MKVVDKKGPGPHAEGGRGEHATIPDVVVPPSASARPEGSGTPPQKGGVAGRAYQGQHGRRTSGQRMAGILLRLLEDLASRETFVGDDSLSDLYAEAKPLLEAHCRGVDVEAPHGRRGR